MYRIGFGSDIHRLEAGGKLILGGVKIESDSVYFGLRVWVLPGPVATCSHPR